VLDDLRARLRATRWPDAADGLGIDVGFLRELCEYWADGFVWPVPALEELPRTRVEVGGLGIHLVHARSGKPPLLLAHGWPDSFWRYAKVVPLLADEFDVVVPDMPGFGYSDRPATPLSSVDVAALWAELMTTLGYERFFVAGGDLGSAVARFLALDVPDRVVAVHRMDAGLAMVTDAELTPEELAWKQEIAAWSAAEGGYGLMHRTKPQTVAVGLTDSPAGVAAWVVEKLLAWGDGALTWDDMLADLTIYWETGTIASSMRMYAANGAIPPAQLARRVEVPSGFALFGGDVLPPPRAWLERTTNLVRLTHPPRGGHFAPVEQPELYAQELRDFFGGV
jgi:pimeloyl-ACP methyl ester carboxylesterase